MGQHRLVRVASIVVAVGALSGLAGLGLGIDLLAGGLPGLRALSPNAAFVILLLAGASLFATGARWQLRVLAAVFATAGSVLGAAALSAYLGGPGAVLDAVPPIDVSAWPFPARMAPQVAVAVVLLGLVVWLRVLGRRASKTRAVLAGAAAMLGAVALVGYLYGADPLFQPFGAPAASPFSALSLILLGVGNLVSGVSPASWTVLAAAAPSSLLLRRVLPLTLAGFIVSGWGTLLLYRTGLVSAEVEAALLVVAVATVTVGLLGHAGYLLNRLALEAEEAHALSEAANRELYQLALELNDDVVQKLSTAWLAQQLDDPDQARDAVQQATGQAERIASALLNAREDPVVPGSLVRTGYLGAEAPRQPVVDPAIDPPASAGRLNGGRRGPRERPRPARPGRTRTPSP